MGRSRTVKGAEARIRAEEVVQQRVLCEEHLRHLLGRHMHEKVREGRGERRRYDHA